MQAFLKNFFGLKESIIKCESGTPPPTHYFFREVTGIDSYKYMTYEQRKALATMHAYHIPLTEISSTLGVHLATLYRELKRGGVEKQGDVYDPDKAEQAIKEHFKKRGRKCTSPPRG